MSRAADESPFDGTSAAGEPSHLARVQRWMQAVITHPGGVSHGADSEAARAHVNAGDEHIEQVICRSRNLTSQQRLDVYASAYWARLLECLQEDFPTLRSLLGDEVFDEIALAYLRACPSQSYTLNELGARLPGYLEATRPREEASDDWSRFLVELATLERAIAEVFDGPGGEQLPRLDAARLAALDADRWPAARLVPVPCLRLLEFQWPVNEYFTAQRHGGPRPRLEPAENFLALSRREYVVRRFPLSRPQHALLSALIAGQCIGEAIEQAAASSDTSLDELAEHLQRWFSLWTAEGFFQSVVE